MGHEKLHSSSTTSCQGDTPQHGSWPARGAWQLLLLCSSSLVKFQGPLLGLQAAMANMASHCLLVYLLGVGLPWCGSLQLGLGSPSPWPRPGSCAWRCCCLSNRP